MNGFSDAAVLAAICTGVLFLLAVPAGNRAARTEPEDPAAVPRIGPPKGWDG